NTLAAKRAAIAEASRRNAEALHAMGIAARVGKLWHQVNSKYLDSHQRASDITGGLGALSKVARLALQSAVLGVGAYLVIHQEASPGIIIAGSIISGRALAPVDLAIANWRGFVAFRQSWGRLKDLLRSSLIADQQMALPVPRSNLVVEDVSLVPRGAKGAVVHDISFALQSGSGLGIIGPSAAGKSCLARALVGVWPAARGTIRIDGAALDQWDPHALSQHVGYLPQDVELLAGTVAQNIARFEENPDAETIVEAANAAGVHELILRLPNGYDTEIGEGGAFLSAGQRQRIALARALFRKPFLLVLDEPNSNLDSEGDEALTRAILQTRERGGIAVVIAHRPSALAGVDMLMAMAHGHVHLLGTKEEILAKLRRATEKTQVAPLRMVEAS
ncbi:MAG: type I secretion system permease/ATPase, partial [Methyloceanibacter sp.]